MAAKKRKRRNYTFTFKKQIVQLYQNGKSKSDIAKEYDVHISLLADGMIIEDLLKEKRIEVD